MKRVLILCSMLSLLVGCSSDFEDNTQTPVGGTTESGLPTVISASAPESEEEEEGTRTYVVDDQNVLWHNGDAIAYFAGVTKAKYAYNGYDGVSKASFDLVSESSISRIMNTNAVYPYDAAINCTFNGTADQLTVNYPAEQTYAVDSFGKGANLMVYMGTTPYGKDENLNFRNACGYFTIKLYSSKTKPVAIKSITLTALGGEKIAGPATVVADSNGIPQITMSHEGTSVVTLNCGNSGKVISNDAEHPTEFWFALPPTTFNSGLRIEVVDVEGATHVKETTNKIVVERNMIKPMAAFKFNYPYDNQLWYTRHTDRTDIMEWYDDENPFDAQITKHYYDEDNKRFVIEFDAPLKVIKETAFKSLSLYTYSKDMASVTLPESLTTIEEEAFYASGITEIAIPGSVTFIDKDAFLICDRLKSLIFYPSPTETPLEMEISTVTLSGDEGPFSFNGWISLTYINVNRNIILKREGELFTPDDADEGIFAGSNSDADMTTVVIGEQMPEIYPYMFAGRNIVEIEIPAHISKIGEGAFRRCDVLTSITIPKTVKSIGVDAFYEATALETVIIEDSNEPLQLGIIYGGDVFTVERGAFYFSPLKNIYLGRDIDYRDGDEPFAPNTWDEGVFAYKEYDDVDWESTITIGDDVTTILESMFYGSRAREITIPASVTEIRARAFEDSRLLKTVRCAGVNPPTFSASAFSWCDELNKIYVPLSAIGNYKEASGWSDYESIIVGY